MLRVTCAVLVYESKILICQRAAHMSMPLKWEFPGGKLEEGESEEACLIREIKEELNIDIRIHSRLTPVEHQYETFLICLIPFWAQVIDPLIKLTEHKAYEWVAPEQILQHDLAPADIPIAHEILKRWNSVFTSFSTPLQRCSSCGK